MKNLLLIIAFSFIGLSGMAMSSDLHIHARAKRVVVVKKVPTKVWVDGHYNWNAKRRVYVWVPGHYIKVKNRKAYVPAHYKKVGGRYVLVKARWVKY